MSEYFVPIKYIFARLGGFFEDFKASPVLDHCCLYYNQRLEILSEVSDSKNNLLQQSASACRLF